MSIRQDDTRAFESLFRAHHGRLCAFAYRYVLDRDAAEDVVEDVFLALWSQRERWEKAENAEAYLYAAVRNRAFNHVKHRRVEERWQSVAPAE
ncbi:MAG: sigma factor, partial [Gemmatimonadaceae bacterium]